MTTKGGYNGYRLYKSITDKQDNSVETQKDMLRSYSKIHGKKIDDYFIDFGISGKETTKRNKYNELMNLVKARLIPLLLTSFPDGVGIP